MATHPLDIFAKVFNPIFIGSISLGRKAATALGKNSIAVGNKDRCQATGQYSAAFGSGAASGQEATAEGSATASGQKSHAEGTSSTASGTGSHAEGTSSTASGAGSHAEGHESVAAGDYSHAEGEGTNAKNALQHVFGTYNEPDPSAEDGTAKGNYAEIVGNGESGSARSNARTLDWNGNERLASDLTIFFGKANQLSLSQLSPLKLLALAMGYAGTWGNPDIISTFIGQGAATGNVTVNGTNCRGQHINLGFTPSKVVIFVTAGEIVIGHDENGVVTPSNQSYTNLLDIACGKKMGAIRIGPNLNYYHSGCGNFRTSAPQNVLARNHGGAVVYNNGFIVQSYSNSDVDSTMHINEKNVEYLYMAWR